MENVSAERSAGWSVLCYVAVLVIASWLTNGMPAPLTMGPLPTALWIDSHRFALLLNAWLTFPAAMFFLWFLVGLRGYLSNAPGRQEGLPTFAMIAGVVMIASAIWTAALLSAAAFPSPDVFKARGLAGIYDAFTFMQSGLGFAPVSIFLLAAAHSMRRHPRAPVWLAWLGYLAALGAAIATLSIFFTDNVFMAPGGPGPGLFGAIPAAVWLVATGLILIFQNRRGSPVESTSAAS
jgi:hypothetical protein